MYAQTNDQTNNQSNNQWNKDLEEQFLSKHWQLVTNKVDHIVFKKENNNYDYFEIKIDTPHDNNSTRIRVSIPLRNSQYQYGTHFNNYFHATEFIEQHLQNYED